MTSLISATESFVRTTLDKDGTGHDWWHCVRVRNTAVGLAREEGADMLVVELGALLHDIADHKLHGGDREKGSRMAREWLAGQGVATEVVEHVVNIVTRMSWSKSHEGNTVFDSLEMRVVQDADRLDALGAIGIARAFATGAHFGQPLYDPEQPLTSEYHGTNTPSTVHHFHEKILKIADQMHTETARKLARERHAYLEGYLERFVGEWSGNV